MARHGGHQGGRPKGRKNNATLSKEMAREALRNLVIANMRPMAEAQMAAAQGLKYLVKRDKRGGKFEVVTEEMVKAGIFEQDDVLIEVWDKQPSTPAFTDLMNRALDKPKEQEQSVKLDGTLVLKHEL